MTVRQLIARSLFSAAVGMFLFACGGVRDGAGPTLDPTTLRDAVPRYEPPSKIGNKTPYFVNGQQQGYRVRTILQSQREDWIQQLVKSGKGVTTLPQYSNVVPGLVLRSISNVDLARTVSLTSVLGSTGNSALQALEKMAARYDWSSVQS